MIPAKNSITLACGVNARVLWSMGTCCNCSNKPCCCRNSPNATSIPCSVLLVGQAGDKLLTGASSTCKATPDRSRRAKLHPIRRFAPWLRKTYANGNRLRNWRSRILALGKYAGRAEPDGSDFENLARERTTDGVIQPALENELSGAKNAHLD